MFLPQERSCLLHKLIHEAIKTVSELVAQDRIEHKPTGPDINRIAIDQRANSDDALRNAVDLTNSQNNGSISLIFLGSIRTWLALRTTCWPWISKTGGNQPKPSLSSI
jgi:hypothetical protein